MDKQQFLEELAKTPRDWFLKKSIRINAGNDKPVMIRRMGNRMCCCPIESLDPREDMNLNIHTRVALAHIDTDLMLLIMNCADRPMEVLAKRPSNPLGINPQEFRNEILQACGLPQEEIVAS